MWNVYGRAVAMRPCASPICCCDAPCFIHFPLEDFVWRSGEHWTPRAAKSLHAARASLILMLYLHEHERLGACTKYASRQQFKHEQLWLVKILWWAAPMPECKRVEWTRDRQANWIVFHGVFRSSVYLSGREFRENDRNNAEHLHADASIEEKLKWLAECFLSAPSPTLCSNGRKCKRTM